MNNDWFEMRNLRRRRFENSVWIPLRAVEIIEENGTYGYVGFKKEFFGLGSLAIPLDRRDQAANLDWSTIGIIHDQNVWATPEHYKPVDVYQYNDQVDLGTELVLVQHFSAETAEWHLHQDFVFAHNLLREGDKWLSTTNGYTEVARLRRDDKQAPIALEVKNEYLRDYLCARAMFLRIAWFRSRDLIVEDIAEVGAPDPIEERTDDERYELSVIPIIEGGYAGDGSFAVFHAARTDVDPEEDVPQPGPLSDANVESRSYTGKREGRSLVRVMGEVWRNEEIEPAPNSPHVRGDVVPTGLRYVVDASGATATSEELNDEDRLRWLWFRPEVVPALIKYRGGQLTWYTKETGGVGSSPGHQTHFGINPANLITVFAYDIAHLPVWQQRVWSGYNVAPEGGISRELHSAQVRAVPAETSAPEADLPRILSILDEEFSKVIGTPLFGSHSSVEGLVKEINRFRALEQGGLYALAKDLNRIVAERINKGPLQEIAPPPAGVTWGTIKSLENYLATISTPEDARAITGPLAGTYELRIADAHLPGNELAAAFELAGVDQTTAPLEQGFQLIFSVCCSLVNVIRLLEATNHEG